MLSSSSRCAAPSGSEASAGAPHSEHRDRRSGRSAERAAAPRSVRERAAFDLLRVEQRERVLASVLRFVAEVGHVPRAMEYFRWRLERDPQTPTQATVYKLFPGGWNAVREALVC